MGDDLMEIPRERESIWVSVYRSCRPDRKLSVAKDWR